MKTKKSLRSFLQKTLLFIISFITISLIIGQKILEQGLLYDFYFFIYGGPGKILLFGIVGFVLFYRDKLLNLKQEKYNKNNIRYLALTIALTISFYILELNMDKVTANLFTIILVHLLFLSIFISLIFGVYGKELIKKFYKTFKKEINYFIIFGLIVYALMTFVWKLWPYLSLVVLTITKEVLKIFGNVIILGERTLIFNGFAAEVAEACSGIYSIFLFAGLYIFGVLLDWKKLNKKKVIFLFIPALIGAFFINVIRVILLFIIGAEISRTVALGLYHSYVGMVFFLIYFTIFWILFFNYMKKKEFKKETKISKAYNKVMKDPLYANSIYLMLSTLIMAALGFIFWIIAARLYSTEQIGLATGLISVMGLITGISVLGLNVGLIRYLPKSQNKNQKINTSFTLVGLTTIIVTCIFLMFSKLISPKLTFVHDNIIMSFIFLIFMIFASLGIIIDSIYTAKRKTKYILLKNSIFSVLKIILLFPLVYLGSYGIFSSWMISLIVGFLTIFTILVYKFNYKPKLRFYDSIFKKMGKYSFGNYLAGFIGNLPIILIPILILNSLGESSAAYYYISMMIAGLLFAVPQATSNALFAEGSYDETKLRNQIKKAAKIISFILIPAIIITFFLGHYILLIFGSDYASEGTTFLKILTLSAIPFSINKVFEGIFKVKRMVTKLVWVNILGSILIISLVFVFMKSMGLLGIGYGWILGHILKNMAVITINQHGK